MLSSVIPGRGLGALPVIEAAFAVAFTPDR
jgi:hypothetical protein